MAHESARHFFKFLMNRKMNMKSLKGVIFDFECNLHRYALNREPLDFEHTRFLLDGSHWQGMKKLKKQDKQSGKKGHFCCSTGYNFNVYKPYTQQSVDGPRIVRAKNRCSISDKLGKSLRQKIYFNLMRYMMAFFAIRNLKIMYKL